MEFTVGVLIVSARIVGCAINGNRCEVMNLRIMVERHFIKGLNNVDGPIGCEQMLELLQLIHENTRRLVLSGDKRQRGDVEATDGLRAIGK